MAIHIGRREFISGAAAWLLTVRAQQPPSVENISRKKWNMLDRSWPSSCDTELARILIRASVVSHEPHRELFSGGA